MFSKIRHYHYILFSLLILSISCVSEFNATLPEEDVDILVVEGNIIENSEVTFYLSKGFSLNSPNVPEESKNIEATLVIIGSDGYESQPATYSGKGAYQIQTGELNDNVLYGIQIVYDGNTYKSTLSKPLHTPEIDSISWAQPISQKDVYFYVSTHDKGTQPQYFLWNYKEDWETRATHYTTFFYNPENNGYYKVDPAPYYYCWKKDNRSRILVGTTESLIENRIINRQILQRDPLDEKLSYVYCLNVSQQSISKSAYEYYLNRLKLNEEMGGLFTPQPSEIMGNINCLTNPLKKVIGYVEVTKNLSQKRMFVYDYKISRPSKIIGCEIMTPDSVKIFLKENRIKEIDLYQMGYQPAGEDSTVGWSTKECVDCVKNGGTKVKPDYWPNNHK